MEEQGERRLSNEPESANFNDQESASETNVIEHVPERTLEAIGVDDHEKIAPPLGREIIQEKAESEEDVEVARERLRQSELMAQLHSQYRVNGAKFLFKDQPNKIAFKDNGSRMVSASNDERVAKAMATLADAKGWKTIKVSGHPDFRREVWLESRLRGIEVRGYKPNEHDLEHLDARLEERMHNVVTQHTLSRNNAADSRTVGQTAVKNENIERTARNIKDRAKRVYAGRILEFGEANYKHDPNENPSYFVKLATAEGDKTIWGIDLQRAVDESAVKTGDNVAVEYEGKKSVEVTAFIRDKNGSIIGEETINTHRNTWVVRNTDQNKVVEAVATALIDEKVKDLNQRIALKAAVDTRLLEREKHDKVPAVMIYDKDAPPQSQPPERTGPTVQRNAERTRG